MSNLLLFGGMLLIQNVDCSDDNEDGQKEYMRSAHGDWLMIPFDSALRNELKVKYGVCAAKEKDAVGVEPRRQGIPTLLGKYCYFC